MLEETGVHSGYGGGREGEQRERGRMPWWRKSPVQGRLRECVPGAAAQARCAWALIPAAAILNCLITLDLHS